MKSYKDLMNFAMDHCLSDDTLIIVPYRETYYSDTELLQLVLKDNSLDCTEDRDYHAKGESLLRLGDIKKCIDKGCEARRKRICSQYEQFIPEKSIHFSLYRNGTTSFGGISVKDFLLIDNDLHLDVRF